MKDHVKIWQRLFILALLSFLASCGVAPEEKKQQVTLGLQSFSTAPSQAVAGTETIWIRAFWVDIDSVPQSSVASALIDVAATTVNLDLPTNTSMVLLKSSYDQVYTEAELTASNPVVLENRVSEFFKISNSTKSLTIEVAVDSFTVTDDTLTHDHKQSGGTDESAQYTGNFYFSRVIDATNLDLSSDTTCSGSIQLSTTANNFSTCLPVTRTENTENDGRHIAVLFGDVALDWSTEYSLKITGLKDTYGNGQAADYNYTFTTEAVDGDTGTGADTTLTAGLISELSCDIPTTAIYKPNMIASPNGGETWTATNNVQVTVNTAELGATDNSIYTCNWNRFSDRSDPNQYAQWKTGLYLLRCRS